VKDLVDRSADPVRVRAVLSQLIDRHPGAVDELDDDSSAALVTVLAASRSLGRLLLRDPEALGALRPGAPRADPPTTGMEAVVAWKQRELLRIAARDLTGAWTVEEATSALATMAADVLAAAHAEATASIADRHRLAVVGMGKMGGSELNYASDVDVLLVGDGDPAALQRAGRTVLDLAGRAFRVDADLRPEGRDGPLVRSLASYEAYWERWAEPWERQALLKAAVVAGDPPLGERWTDAARSIVWDTPFAADDLRALRAMKVRSEAQARQQLLAERDVKRAQGGIRDIEFAVQLLQLVHGGVDHELRSRSTLGALGALAQGGYVAGDDAEDLASSYRFLRRVEHAVQLDDERQTHRVPEDRAQRRRLARTLGFSGSPAAGPTEAFDRELADRRSRVRATHERLWFRPLLAALAGAGPLGPDAAAERLTAFGFTDVERTRQAVSELTRGLTRSSRMMQQVLPLLLEWLSESPDPDLALLGLRKLASGEQRSRALATAFRESPDVARRLALLLGTSRQLGEILVANPDLIERLPDADRLRTRGRSELVDSAESGVAWRRGTSDRQRALQRWGRRHLLGVAARDVFGDADVAVVGEDLTRLAEATLEVALASLRPTVPIGVLAFGRFGGGELGYASDLDVAFVHDGADSAEADRVASGLLRLVGGDTPAERIWLVDADLRPEGRSGPLSRSREGWRRYLERWASTWERQAYLRARAVAGDRQLGQALVEEIQVAIGEQPFTAEQEREVRRMKARMEQERIAPGEDPDFHLKLGRGSLSDIEFTVQLLQLRHGVAGTATMAALGALVAAGHLPGSDADALRDAYRFCEGTRNRSYLVVGAGDALPTRPEQITPLARSLGFTPTELREEYRRVTRRARRVVEHRFYGRR
jgi:[glutamine synthetase] adenylyltransferase / [glutamine synthetase]-adenylyl-L-tyrosine phosphorylase